MDVVLIDYQQPFGNEHLLPRGTLREPPSHLARANAIFITKSDGKTAELRRRIAQYNPSAGIIECIHHPLYLEDVFTGQRADLEVLKGHKVASFSGIAQPESFEQSLVTLGGELVYAKRFADHHRFQRARKSLFEDRHQIPVRSRFRHADEAAHALSGSRAVGEQTPAQGILVIFDVFKK